MRHTVCKINYPPQILIEGDGNGASATAQIDFTTGKLTGITITNGGSGYTSATVSFQNGWVTSQQVDEYVLGETVAMGLTAFTTSGEIQEIRLIAINFPSFGSSLPFPFKSKVSNSLWLNIILARPFESV